MSFHRFLVGHVLDDLRSLPDESVHFVVTSPPYFGLRDYGLPHAPWPEVEYAPMPGLPPMKVPAWEGQLGLEPSPEMYVAHLALVFREIRRVLRHSGTCWVVIGDSYNGSGGAGGDYNPGGARKGQEKYPGRKLKTLKPKDLIGIPWRVAFALQADGWFLRSEITWCKKTPLPESVEDRPTSATEKIFLFAKGKKYFYDYEAAREPYGGGYRGSSFTAGKTGAVKPNAGRKEREERPGRNAWNYWLLGPEPFPDAHFAVFPTEIPRRVILTGTSPKACPVCGAPWERVAERKRTLDGSPVEPGGWPADGNRRLGPQGFGHWRFATVTENIGWRPGCPCPGNDGSARCLVLDPFGGAGTTTLVAMELERDSIYVDLSRRYSEMALKRCGFDGTLLDCHSFEVTEISAAAEMPA
jgi:DNA modification methylase